MTIGDEYDRRARIYPALLAVAPLSITGVVLGITSPEWWSAVASVAVASGFWFLAAQVGRSPGKRLEPGLWATWGGPPTTILLRHRDNPNRVHLERVHVRVASVAGFPMPTASDEEASPETADETYEAATRELIAKTRDPARFALLFKENINYGFRRNMLGLRPWGIAACIVAAGFTGLTAIAGAGPLEVEPGTAVTLIGLDGLSAVAWWRFVNAEWVKQPAFAYAERLLETTVQLSSK